MTKPTVKHTKALNQQLYLLRNARASAIEPKFQKALDRDMNSIREVREMLLHAIENPTLPFANLRDESKETPVGGFFRDLGEQLEKAFPVGVPVHKPIYHEPNAKLNPIEDEPDAAF